MLLEAAERVVRGESATLISLTGANPMDLLLEPPGNYAGSGSRSSAEGMPRRSWYFVEDDRLLVYRPGREASFEALEKWTGTSETVIVASKALSPFTSVSRETLVGAVVLLFATVLVV